MRADPPRTNWNLETGYKRSNSETPYPYRAFGSGSVFSLEIILRVFHDDERLCRIGKRGFKVMFTAPGEISQKLLKHHLISVDRTTLFTIIPMLKVTTESARYYAPNVRGCYFRSERTLHFYKHYTQRNCEMECLRNFTLAQCGCVKFSMPRKNST